MLHLDVTRIIRAIGAIILVVVGLHLLLNVAPIDFIGADTLRPVFHVDNERSVPTYLATALLGLTALVLAAIAGLERGEGAADDRDRLYWAGLAVLFALASLDEVATLHEMTIAPIRRALGLSGFLRFAWVLPATALLAVLAVVYFRFWTRLPRATRIGFAVGAGLFVLGAIGFELPGGYFKEQVGIEGMAYRAVSTIEETLEFVGSLTMFAAFLGHLRRRYARVELVLR